jgi:probable rRNA maturation factor
LPGRQLRRIAEKMMAVLRVDSCELSILLCDDETIHRLNFKHRGKNRATDVLSFPLMDPDDETLQTLEGGALGDIVISLDTAQRQAARAGHDLLDEVRVLLAHGMLHLLGYDHQTDDQETEMNELAKRLVEASRSRSARAR